MNPSDWTSLIKTQEDNIANIVSDINKYPLKANSLRKQYVKDIDVLIQTIEAFHNIMKPYLISLQTKVKSQIRDEE